MKGHMNPFLMAGMGIVFFALASYTTALYFEVKTRLAKGKVLVFFTAGVALDITSTICMILGSRHAGITAHGLLGYSALAAMLVETALLWRHSMAAGKQVKVSAKLHAYSIAAYAWWVTAFIAGAMLVMLRK